MQQCQVNFQPIFDPNEWCLKNGLLSGGLIPPPLNHESSALTTRPRLLAKKKGLLANYKLKKCHRIFLSEVVKKSWLLIWKVFGLPTFENS